MSQNFKNSSIRYNMQYQVNLNQVPVNTTKRVFYYYISYQIPMVKLARINSPNSKYLESPLKGYFVVSYVWLMPQKKKRIPPSNARAVVAAIKFA